MVFISTQLCNCVSIIFNESDGKPGYVVE